MMADVNASAADSSDSQVILTTHDDQLPTVLLMLIDQIDTLTQLVQDKMAQIHVQKELQLERNNPRPGGFGAGMAVGGDPSAWPGLQCCLLLDEEEETELHRLGRQHTVMQLKFDNLASALRASQRSLAIKKALQLQQEEDDEFGPGNVLELDQQEREYIEDLLSEHTNLTDFVLQLEEQRLQVFDDLVLAKLKLQNECASVCRLFPGLVNVSKEVTGVRSTDTDRHRLGVMTKTADVLAKKQKMAKDEQKKLEQIKTILQRLIFSSNRKGKTSEEKEQDKKMLIRCGQTVDELCGENEQSQQ